MSLKIDRSGLDKLLKNIKSLEGTHQVPLTESLSAVFVSSHSRFADFDALLAEAGITTKEEFEAYPDADFDAFIAANTDFDSWVDMQKQGMAAYVRRQLTK